MKKLLILGVCCLNLFLISSCGEISDQGSLTYSEEEFESRLRTVNQDTDILDSYGMQYGEQMALDGGMQYVLKGAIPQNNFRPDLYKNIGRLKKSTQTLEGFYIRFVDSIIVTEDGTKYILDESHQILEGVLMKINANKRQLVILERRFNNL